MVDGDGRHVDLLRGEVASVDTTACPEVAER